MALGTISYNLTAMVFVTRETVTEIISRTSA